MMHRPPPDDFSLKERKLASTYDPVEQMQYLYVRVMKARELTAKDVTGICDPYAEVRWGNYKGRTRHFEMQSNPEWNQVFAFSRDGIQSTMLEVTVNDKDVITHDFMGWVLFDLIEVPKRVPPDTPVAPQWYRLEDRKGMKLKGEIMLAVWWGNQADEVFPEAWHLDAATVDWANIRSKVYLSPKLWYLRVNVIEAQDLVPGNRTGSLESFVKATLGNQSMTTKISMTRSGNPFWNEEMMFVAAEPFEEQLILSVVDQVAPNKDEVLGMCVIPLRYVDRRFDYRGIRTRWFNLQGDVIVGEQKTKQAKFSSRIHMRICLEGGYHVLHEPAHYISDFRPAAKKLWNKSIGILELGILGAHGLSPMKTKHERGTTDAYCVAKYGTKWVRTRTIIDSLTPKWNEQYTWEVFDPCTAITIGVFNNSRLEGADTRIGKVRIRVSTLESGRVYSHLYPLIVLIPSGLKRMGEINLAVRFTCSSRVNMMHMYTKPLLPEMHYIHPLTVTQVDSLRYHATHIVSMRLSQAEPPLRKEVVEYMLDVGCDMWSMRRSKANFLRIKGVFVGFKWFSEMYNWKNPISTVAIHVIFFILAMYPQLVLPSIFLSLFAIGVWNFKHRPRYPPHIDTHLSCVDDAHPDELDEEFDTFPTPRSPDVISMRYERLRSESGWTQRVVGDIATQGERLQSLLSWRDPMATKLFVIFCLIAAIVLYATPFYVVVIQTVIYALSFKNKLPSVPVNFFTRLPDKTDSML